MITKEALIEKYPNGQIEWFRPIEWHVFGAYRLHGETIQYYPTGEVKLRRTYEHGVEVGEEIIYYRDGSVMSVLPFKNGKKEGTHTFTHPDGKKETVEYAGGAAVAAADQKEKGAKDDTEREPGTKKILPGDHIPASVSRKSA